MINGVTLTEFIEDAVGIGLVVDTASIDWVYNDVAGTLEANVIPEFIEDTVGAMLTDTASVDLVYNDGTGQITAAVLPAGVDHNSLANLTTGDPHTQYPLAASAETIGGAWDFSVGLDVPADNQELRLGAGNDLRLYHNGTNSVIRNDTGSLLLLAGATTRVTVASDGKVDITNDNSQPLLVSGTVNNSSTFQFTNASNGTSNAARISFSSGDANAAFFAAGSGRTSAIVTGGPTGAQAVMRTLGAYPLIFGVSNTYVAAFDNSTTARDTRFLIYDVDNGQVERVSVGVADSGGAGFKVLRIPN